MKRYCKNIDITDRSFISIAVKDCIYKRLTRHDTIELLCHYTYHDYESVYTFAKYEDSHFQVNKMIDKLINDIQLEIIHKQYKIKPIRYHKQIDGCSGKERIIGIQDIKQQLYDYIAVYGLSELFDAKIGYYQCSAIKNKGQIFGVKAIKKWVNNHHIRYAIQSDIKHFYQSIDKNVLKNMLKRDVKNKNLLHLTFFLIDSYNNGLSIGSYLSQFLANYYLSTAYHYITEQCFRIRKHKDGTSERINLVDHALLYADDCILLGSNLKDLKKAQKLYTKFAKEKLHIEVKPEIKIINLQTDYIDMMGYKISRKNITIRSSDFIRLRRNQKRVEKYPEDDIPLHEARSYCSRTGALKHTDSKHYCKRTHALETKRKCNKIISRCTKSKLKKEQKFRR